MTHGTTPLEAATPARPHGPPASASRTAPAPPLPGPAPRRRWIQATAWAAVAVSAATLTAAFTLHRYPDGPPPGHTGGFGEPTCNACHFDGALNDPAGSAILAGVPAAYVPGATYTITVAVARPGLRAGGFQLAARFVAGDRAGRQAGVLTPVNTRAAVVDDREVGVSYAQHTFEGTEPVAPDTARWRLEWTAPAAGGAVAFHVAANAADGDASPFGDWIYTASAETRSASARASASPSGAGSARRMTTSGVPCQAATSRSAPAMSRASAAEGRTPCSR